MYHDASNEETPWKWKSLANLGLQIQEQEKLKKILRDRPINFHNREEKIIWAASKDGTYKVKEGYKIIINSQRWEEVNIPLNLCWDTIGLPKAGIFLWEVAQSRILTTDRIRKMGFEGPSRCLLCKEEAETTEHIFYNCKYAKEC